MAGRLDKYRRNRRFGMAAEPRGGEGLRSVRTEPGRLFVVQKHEASSLHYDFRLEADGVLKSWAAPKVPSVNPRDKRLVMSTEDQPPEYAEFEGTIPEGEYDAGTVLVWDIGSFEHQTEEDKSISDALESGRVNVWLEGHKCTAASP